MTGTFNADTVLGTQAKNLPHMIQIDDNTEQRLSLPPSPRGVLPPPLLVVEVIQVRSCSRACLMYQDSPVPNRALSLHNTNDLFGKSLGKHTSTAAPGFLLAGCLKDPFDRLSPSLPLAERNGNLQSRTSTSGAPL